MHKSQAVYLDNNATTRPNSNVVAAMVDCLLERYGNPTATSAALFGANSPALEAAKAMTRLFNAEASSCFRFTSGATEANNWVFHHIGRKHTTSRIVISAIEHASVSEPAKALSEMGHDLVVVPVKRNGRVDLSVLATALNDDVSFVSVITANNETGAVQPIEEIGKAIRGLAPRALFHTDATQAVGKMPVDVQRDFQDADLISFSSHKFHGPKGIGGIYIRPGINISPWILGGGQQDGLRSGTDNTPGLAGLAVAAKQSLAGLPHFVRELRNVFEDWILTAFPGSVVYCSEVHRVDNTSCFSIPGYTGSEVADRLSWGGVFVGTGAACSSGALKPPKTLLAMGIPYEEAQRAVRVSFSRDSTQQDLQRLQSALAKLL